MQKMRKTPSAYEKRVREPFAVVRYPNGQHALVRANKGEVPKLLLILRAESENGRDRESALFLEKMGELDKLLPGA